MVEAKEDVNKMKAELAIKNQELAAASKEAEALLKSISESTAVAEKGWQADTSLNSAYSMTHRLLEAYLLCVVVHLAALIVTIYPSGIMTHLAVLDSQESLSSLLSLTAPSPSCFHLQKSKRSQ